MARIIFMPKRRTLLRLTISFVLLVLTIVSLTVFLIYNSIKDEIFNQLTRRASDAAVVSGRLAERSTASLSGSNFMNKGEYKKLFSNYFDIVEGLELDNIYIVDRKMNCLLKVKGPPIDTAEEYIHLVDHDFKRVFAGEQKLSGIYLKKGRLFISAYVPVFRQGRVDQILGVDLNISRHSLLQRLKGHSLLILGATFLASLFLAAFLSYTFVTPIKNMVKAAEEIGMGNFSVVVPVSKRDELGFLGQTMNDMIQDIKQRDEKIKELTDAIIDDLRVYNELILEGMKDGVLGFNFEGRVETINPAACKILGYTEEQVIAHEFSSLNVFHGKLLNKILVAIEKGKFFDNYKAQLNREDRDTLVNSDFGPLIDSEGNTIGYMLFLADITEIRKLETQIKLKEKLAAIGELSAGIAHEIRNPLNSIELFLGLLQRKLKDQPEQINLVGKVRTEIELLNSILSDFLKFARPMPLNLTSEDLAEVVEDSMFFAKAAIEQNKINVVLDMPTAPMFADIDRQHIQGAFTNLILNATQAMEEKGKLKITGASDEGGAWEVSFSDTGHGIPADDLPRIFDPFFTTKDTGTGLGLAMVHKIIDTHGGSINVSSSDKGTTFTINLPKAGTLYDIDLERVRHETRSNR